jgi:hypothetical protein
MYIIRRFASCTLEPHDTALVEMFDGEAAQRCLKYLDGVKSYGIRISLKLSRKNRVSADRSGSTLAGGTLIYKDYSDSKDNRLTPDQVKRNTMWPPDKVSSIRWFFIYILYN